jgi:hypothetical protein
LKALLAEGATMASRLPTRDEDFLYEVRIPNFFLDKKGVYRIRLIFHSEKFLKNFQPCKTDWVYVSIE